MEPSQLIIESGMKFKTPKTLERVCDVTDGGCGQPFTLVTDLVYVEKYNFLCERCWKIRENQNQVDYELSVSAARERALKAPFDEEMMIPWDVARGCAGSIFDAVMRWRPDDKRKGLFIHGSNGQCKTRMACLLACELQELLGFCIFRPMPKFVAEVSSYGQRHFKEMMDQLVKAPLLVFDDMTFGEQSGISDAKISYLVVDGRYRARKPTIITSNNGPQEISDGNNWFRKSIQSRIGFSYSKIGVGLPTKTYTH